MGRRKRRDVILWTDPCHFLFYYSFFYGICTGEAEGALFTSLGCSVGKRKINKQKKHYYCSKTRHGVTFEKGKWGRKWEFKVSLKTWTPGSAHAVFRGRAAAAKANFSSLLRSSIRFESGLHPHGS